MSVGAARRWTGTDYLLHGRFCPPTQLGISLGEIRDELDAAAALLVVAGPRGLLRSLCVFDGPGREGAVAGFLSPRKVRVYDRLRPPSTERKTERDYPASGQWLVAQTMRAAGGALDALDDE